MTPEEKRQKHIEYMKEYNAKNRERIRELMREKVYCRYCDKELSKHNLTRHKNTIAHKKNKEENNGKKLRDEIIKAVKKELRKMNNGK